MDETIRAATMSEVDINELDNAQLDELQERLDEREQERNTAASPPETTTPKIEPWNTDDDWTNLSEVADRIYSETKNVEYIDEEHSHASDPDGTVVVTLEHDGNKAKLRFPVVQWLNDTGRTALFDQYRQKFGESLNLDGHDWGILQYRWLHRYQSTAHTL